MSRPSDADTVLRVQNRAVGSGESTDLWFGFRLPKPQEIAGFLGSPDKASYRQSKRWPRAELRRRGAYKLRTREKCHEEIRDCGSANYLLCHPSFGPNQRHILRGPRYHYPQMFSGDGDESRHEDDGQI